MWKKYWTLASKAFIKNLEFRAELLVYFFTSTLPFVVLFLVWGNIFNSGETLSGFSFESLVGYYFLVFLISGFTSTRFEGMRSSEIRQGKIDLLLTKPIHYFALVFFYDLGGNIAFFLATLPFFLLFLGIIVINYSFELIMPSGWQLAQFAFLMFVGYGIEFMLALVSVILTFWFEGAEGLQHFKWISITLFSGSMIPLAFMPVWLQSFTNKLPLKYMYAVPIDILQLKSSLQLPDLIFIGLTFFSISTLIFILWKKGLHRYSSAGG